MNEDKVYFIEPSKCSGCAACKNSCPFNAIENAGGVSWISENCQGCGICVDVCNNKAIGLKPAKTHNDGIISKTDVIAVFAEHNSGELHKVVPELMTIALDLAEQKSSRKIVCYLIGSKSKLCEKTLYSWGADTVCIIDKDEINQFSDDLIAAAIVEATKKTNPDILLGGATILGRSVFPRVSARLKTGLTADCTSLSINPATGLLEQTRPAYGGNLMATIVTRHKRPQMATVRQGVFRPVDINIKKEKKLIHINDIQVSPSRIKLLGIMRGNENEIDISESDTIIAIGRGVMHESLPYIRKLAKYLNGNIGGTRSAVENGLIPYKFQIGQTGKNVKPSLYLAFGISGAVQHLVGMRDSSVVIAVNNDPGANIFKMANYGIIADANEIIRKLVGNIGEKSSE